MGLYLNAGSKPFESALNGEYVDKTGLIAEINATLHTERRCSCVSRCRRFGKSMAAKMLAAYYDQSCDSRALFKGLEIERHPSFEEHLNKYLVIRIDMTGFLNLFENDALLIRHIQEEVIADVVRCYPDIVRDEGDDLMKVLHKVVIATGKQFFMIIDEWDAICRERNQVMDEYVRLLRRLFKGDNTEVVFAGVYMTGILPIKKYNTESALNNFWEYSMVDPGPMPTFFGFTREEVAALCAQYGMDAADMKEWYDGYTIGDEASIFNPKSVMEALVRRRCRNYWSKTGSFDAVARYIGMNYDGLKDDIVCMLGGGRCKVKCSTFGNDPAIINSKDEVLTLLIHLGYLAYDWNEEKCYIPNKEVAMEMEGAVEANNWHEVMEAIRTSDRLMDSLLEGDAETVAAVVEKVHQQNTSIIRYNDENSLSCVLTLAFYAAMNDYAMVREMPAGKGFADLVLVPRRNVDKPAVIMELKWNKDAMTAIDQIRSRDYHVALKGYVGDVLLCGITYDVETKKHTCMIEHA